MYTHDMYTLYTFIYTLTIIHYKLCVYTLHVMYNCQSLGYFKGLKAEYSTVYKLFGMINWRVSAAVWERVTKTSSCCILVKPFNQRQPKTEKPIGFLRITKPHLEPFCVISYVSRQK